MEFVLVYILQNFQNWVPYCTFHVKTYCHIMWHDTCIWHRFGSCHGSTGAYAPVDAVHVTHMVSTCSSGCRPCYTQGPWSINSCHI